MSRLNTILREFPNIGPLRPNAAPILHQGFSGAKVWAIETETGRYAVRHWPAGWQHERLAGLHALLWFLHDGGLAFIAPPLPSRNGDTFVIFKQSLWQVEPWLPGRADYLERPSRDRLTRAMTALARWHRRAAQFTPVPEVEAWFTTHADRRSPAVTERLQRLRSLSAVTIPRFAQAAASLAAIEARSLIQRVSELISRHSPVVTSELEVVAETLVPLQPVLRDVWHDHVLFTGDEVTGLIDPSACRTESVAADLARLLGSLVGDDAAEWDFALIEYQRHRPLSPSELAMIPVLDRSGVLLSAVTWLEWLGPQQRVPVDDPRVLPRLCGLAERLERFDAPRAGRIWTPQ